MTITIKNRYTGEVMKTIEADSLHGANLRGADLVGADLRVKDASFCVVNFSKNEYEQAKQFIGGLKP